MGIKQFWFYAFRWQLSTLVLAPCIYLLPNNAVLSAVVSNFIGAGVFFWVDKYIIFKQTKIN